jgi:thymidine kinase
MKRNEKIKSFTCYMGYLEVICGPMFAGKSTSILSAISRAKIFEWKYLLFTSSMDTRYDTSGTSIQTHDGLSIPAIPCKNLEDIIKHPEYVSANMIIIEEAQFFTNLYNIVKYMLDIDNKHILIVGLDGDSERKPFGEVLSCISLATKVTRLTAYCRRCNSEGSGIKEAPYTALVKSCQKKDQILVGGSESYEPMCLTHYLKNSL